MKESRERICEFCGRTVVYYRSEDSWNVGHYGCTSPEVSISGYNCGCKSETLFKDMCDSFTKCCANCVSNQDGYCVNKSAINKASQISEKTPFDTKDLPSKIKIKYQDKKCGKYRMNINIFKIE